MQATDLTPRGLELEVYLHGPSPPEERGGLKRGLHSNCWGEVRRTVAHVIAILEFTYPCQPSGRGKYMPPSGRIGIQSSSFSEDITERLNV